MDAIEYLIDHGLAENQGDVASARRKPSRSQPMMPGAMKTYIHGEP